MKFGNLTLNNALEYLRSKRPTVGYPMVNFKPALEQFQKDLFNSVF